jgi:YbbR domain-containing protein
MRKIIFENLGLKLFSLLFAILLWFFVSGKRQSYTEISYTLPLEFKNISSDFIITNDFQDKIEIRISGPTTLLNSVRSEKLKYTLDLSDVHQGETSFNINPENIDLLRGLKITKISPSKLNLVLEKIINKSVPVKLNLVGEPPEGYIIMSQTISPASVEIKGAQNEVDSIDAILTVEVDISESTSTIQKDLDLIFTGIFHSEIIGEKNISATIGIVEEILDKEFKNIKVAVRGAKGERYRLKPNKMDIVLTGTFLSFKDFKKDSITAYINAENVSNKPEMLKPVVELPLNLTIKETKPELFEVLKISKRKKK